jgi:hypothetical protein
MDCLSVESALESHCLRQRSAQLECDGRMVGREKRLVPRSGWDGENARPGHACMAADCLVSERVG